MPFGLFSRKPQALLGVDIGTSSVKIVEITRAGNKSTLSNYGEMRVDGENKNTARHISQIMTRAGMRAQMAAMGIPVFSSFSTIIDLPDIPDAELTQAITSEARKYVPVPLAEITLDWAPVPFLSRDKGLKVLMVAVPNDVVNKYASIARNIGVRLHGIELETFSSARSLAGENPDATFVLDIGHRSTNMSIVEGGVASIHHNIDVSGSEFTKAIARGMSIDAGRARQMKHEEGIAGDTQVRDLITPLLDAIILEIQRITQDYKQRGGKVPSSILLAGGSAHLPGLARHVEQALSTPTLLGEPFRAVSYPRALTETIQEIGPSFAVAAGLALRNTQ